MFPIPVLSWFKKLCLNEGGQDLVEYALVVAVVSLGIVACMQSFATEVANAVTSLTNTFSAQV
jgi:Flp pilus assembly pilin Flp